MVTTAVMVICRRIKLSGVKRGYRVVWIEDSAEGTYRKGYRLITGKFYDLLFPNGVGLT